MSLFTWSWASWSSPWLSSSFSSSIPIPQEHLSLWRLGPLKRLSDSLLSCLCKWPVHFNQGSALLLQLSVQSSPCVSPAQPGPPPLAPPAPLPPPPTTTTTRMASTSSFKFHIFKVALLLFFPSVESQKNQKDRTMHTLAHPVIFRTKHMSGAQ